MGGSARGQAGMHLVTTRRPGVHREYVTHLLRRSYREAGKVKKETIANLSRLPEHVVALVREALAGKEFVETQSLAVERSLPHGHVEAVLTAMRRLGMANVIDPVPSKSRDRVLAMIAQRVIEPGSKACTSRMFADSTLTEELSLGSVGEDDLYSALDWLLERQADIEKRLAQRHIERGGMALYDLSSSYFYGRRCPLALRGYSRDKRRGTPQIVYGLLCDRLGRPVAVEVFAGNTVDAQSVPAQVRKLREHFALKDVVLVADRGMVSHANLELVAQQEMSWITALRSGQVQRLVKAGTLPLSLFEEHSLVEITSPDFPDERLIVCRNPLVAAERRRKRNDLLAATEKELQPIVTRVAAGTLRGKAKIGLAVGAVANRFRVRKHFDIVIEDDRCAVARRAEQIAAEEQIDGIYVIRTSVEAQTLAAAEVVRSYKQLSTVERAFRTLKGMDLQIRPVHHHLEPRVRAHVLLCMLAYYVEWHLREAWKPLTFTG